MSQVQGAPRSLFPLAIMVSRPLIRLAALLALWAVPALAQTPIPPVINSISPIYALAGSADLPLTVNTNAFTSAGTPTIFFNGQPLPNTTTGGTNIWTGTVSSILLTNPGVVPVTIQATSGTSPAVNFTIVGTPTITGFSPVSLTQGNVRALDILGSNFLAGDTVYWDFGAAGGLTFTPTSVTPTDITITLSAAAVTTPGLHSVFVRHSDSLGFGQGNTAQIAVNPAPVLSSLSQSSSTATAAGFTLGLIGSNFLTGMTVTWMDPLTANGRPLTLASTVTSGTLISATIPVNLLAAATNATISVVTPDGYSVSLPYSVVPVPTISTLSPASVTAGHAQFTLTVNGSFQSNVTVQWNGSSRATPTVTNGQAQATILPADVATPGTANVRVITSDLVASNSLAFTVNPPPAITSFSPIFRTAGQASPFTLTINGTNFSAGDTVIWNVPSTPLSVTSASSIQLQVTVPASFTTSPVTVPITVVSVDGASSAAASYSVLAAPTLTSISPTSHTAGFGAFTLTLTGTNFAAADTVVWNNAGASTTLATLTAGQTTVSVPAALIAFAGSASVTVVTPDGVSTAAQPFTINAVPTISTLTPSSAIAGGAGFTLTVSGSFQPNVTVQWNASSRATPTVTNGQALATIPASDIVTPGTANVTVVTSDAISSNALPFTISKANSTGALTTNPSGTVAFGASVTLTATFAGVGTPASLIPSGTVTFTDSSTNTTLGTGALNSSGVATLTTSALSPGVNKTLTATWPGDANFSPPATAPTATITVSAAAPTVSLSPSPTTIAMGAAAIVTFTATVTGGPANASPAGTVLISDAGAALSAGSGTCLPTGNNFSSSSGNSSTMVCTVLYDGSTPDRASGIHSITATYLPSGASAGVLILGTSTAQTVTVTAASPLIATPASAPASPLVLGQQTTISVAVSGLAPPTAFNALSGSVNFFDGATQLNASPIALAVGTNNIGTASLPAQSFSVGNHSITARYTGSTAGSPAYSAVNSAAYTLVVTSAATSTTLSAANASTVFGTGDLLTASVTVNSPAVGTPTGTVSLQNSGATFASGTLTANGQFTYTLSTALPAGVYSNLTAVYSGDATNGASTSPPLSLTIAKNSTTGSLTVNPVGPSSFGQSETLTATFTPANSGAGTPTGTVTFVDVNTNTTLGTAPLNSSGVATLTTSAITTGTKTLMANWPGDANFVPPGTPPTATLTVNPVTPTVTLVATPTSVSMGTGAASTVTYSISVTGGPANVAPAGTVTIRDFSTPVSAGTGTCAGPLTLTAGTGNTSTASCTLVYDGSTGDRAAGGQTMTAAYTPAGASAGSLTAATSAAQTVTVNPASAAVGTPTATATVGALPLVSGQPAAISVTVTGLQPGTAYNALTGTVTFLDGATQLSAAPITLIVNSSNVGTAALPARGFAAGQHNITAQYSGSAVDSPGYSGATSARLALTVGLANTTTTLTAASSSFVSGGSDLLTATVGVTGNGAGTPTGTVSFRAGTQVLGTVTLTNGIAVYNLTTALATGSYTLTAVYNGDANDSASTSAGFAITVSPVSPPPPNGITVSFPGALQPGTVGSGYSASFGATGGTGTINWSVTGGSLPDGIGFSSGGFLSGTPTTAGTFSFTVTATDSTGLSGSRTFSLLINPLPLVVTGDVAATATVGANFSLTFGATGGVQPYKFSVSGSLPPGTSVSGNTISGVITGAGTAAFTVTVTDSTGTIASKSYSVTVAAAALSVVGGSLPGGQVGVVYSGKVAAAGGKPPYQFSGTAPANLSVGADGSVTGTPAASGQFTVSVAVTDAAGGKATGSYTLNIIPAVGGQATLSITTLSLPDGAVNTPYSAGVAVTGGTKPYTFGFGGTPDGVTGNSDGTLTGTPTTPGPFTITVTVTDAAGKTATQSYSINVVPAPLALTLTAGNGTVGTAYSGGASAAGGVKPYTFSATGLPAGVAIASGTGALSGTPTVAGPTTLAVTVTDAAGKTATRSVQVTINLPATPPVNLTGVSATGTPGGQQSVQITLGSTYPVDVNVVLTLTFTPDSGGDDPTVVFSTGGRTAQLTIPAGATVSIASVGVQTGTVAGVITITAKLAVGNTDITPSPAPTRTIRIAAAPPTISTATATRNTSGFTVVATGFVTDREITSAMFTFNAASGATLQTNSVTIPVDSLFSAWFSSASASAFGSQFTFTQPFTVQGNAQSIVSVVITLVNKVGSSSPVTVTLQ